MFSSFHNLEAIVIKTILKICGRCHKTKTKKIRGCCADYN